MEFELHLNWPCSSPSKFGQGFSFKIGKEWQKSYVYYALALSGSTQGNSPARTQQDLRLKQFLASFPSASYALACTSILYIEKAPPFSEVIHLLRLYTQITLYVAAIKLKKIRFVRLMNVWILKGSIRVSTSTHLVFME